MKKLFIVSIILLSLTLVWCSQNKLSQDELFEKKQECLWYKENLEEIIKKNELYAEKEWWRYDGKIKEIFYSKKENTCIWIISDWWKLPSRWIFYEITITDILTNESNTYDDGGFAYDIIYLLKWEQPPVK